jgi:hypothetical protein
MRAQVVSDRLWTAQLGVRNFSLLPYPERLSSSPLLSNGYSWTISQGYSLCINYYFYYYWWGGTKSLGTVATSGPLYKPQMIDELHYLHPSSA